MSATRFHTHTKPRAKRELALGGKKTILTSSSDLASSKFGGCPGVLSSNRTAFWGRLFWLQNCNTLWQKCLEYHSEKICCVTQAFLYEVQMTGKWDFRIPFITLGVSEWHTSIDFKFRVPNVFPPRGRLSRPLDALKPGTNFSSLKIEVLEGNLFQYNPVSSTLKTSGEKSLSSIIFLNLLVKARVASELALAASPLIFMQWICERCLNLAKPSLCSHWMSCFYLLFVEFHQKQS